MLFGVPKRPLRLANSCCGSLFAVDGAGTASEWCSSDSEVLSSAAEGGDEDDEEEEYMRTPLELEIPGCNRWKGMVHPNRLEFVGRALKFRGAGLVRWSPSATTKSVSGPASARSI